MKIGDVYLFYGDKSKVLMFDENEVFYDTFTKDDILLSGKYKTTYYSRTTRNFFDKNSTFISASDITEKDLLIHRPDLPLRLNCFKGIFWSNEPFENISNFISFLNLVDISEKTLINLMANKIIIYPQGQLQSIKKPILLENNIGFFTGVELLFKCFNIQCEYVKKGKPYFSRFRLIPNGREEKRLTGIGLYRIGIKGNIPSYCLGGCISPMELELNKSLIV